LKAEAEAVQRILSAYRARPALRWPIARLDEHARAVRDPGDLFRLADRDVLLVLDGDARRSVARSARRVAVVSAISPTGLLTVSWVLVENLRLLRTLAGLYGGRPGFVGTMRLARMVFLNIVATGSIAMTDDLLGQFIGQDLLRRVSARLGESVFNAALTARVGAVAIGVIRPLPYLEAAPVRARDFMADILRPKRASSEAEPDGRTKPGPA
jgi:putative membrane protein